MLRRALDFTNEVNKESKKQTEILTSCVYSVLHKEYGFSSEEISKFNKHLREEVKSMRLERG